MSVKSLEHVYAVGEQVFDLPSGQVATIVRIWLVKGRDGEWSECQSAECISIADVCDGLYTPDDFFAIEVDAPPTEDFPRGVRVFGEFCLPEEADVGVMDTPEARKRLCRDRYASPEDLDNFDWGD
jgi:hypothetical protein